MSNNVLKKKGECLGKNDSDVSVKARAWSKVKSVSFGEEFYDFARRLSATRRRSNMMSIMRENLLMVSFKTPTAQWTAINIHNYAYTQFHGLIEQFFISDERFCNFSFCPNTAEFLSSPITETARSYQNESFQLFMLRRTPVHSQTMRNRWAYKGDFAWGSLCFTLSRAITKYSEWWSHLPGRGKLQHNLLHRQWSVHNRSWG